MLFKVKESTIKKFDCHLNLFYLNFDDTHFQNEIYKQFKF